MHGRLKVRTTEEQEERKRLEHQKQQKIYQDITKKIFDKRAINIHDEENLSHSAKILAKIPEFYTLWNLRREILLFLKSSLNEEEIMKYGSDELRLTEIALRENPKSYGAWHHRLWAMEYFTKPDWNWELKLCNMFLKMDDRNFHCWDYRRIVAKKCSTDPKDELSFTIDLIKKNFSNYSAWHYRSKLLPEVHPGSGDSLVDEDVLLKEYELVQNAAFTDPNDQSVWFYHRWLLGRGVPDLEVNSLSVLVKEQIVLVFLTVPIKVNNENLKLFMDGVGVDVTWLPPGNEINGSQLWYCKISSDMGAVESAAQIHVEMTQDNKKSTLCCIFGSTKFCTVQPTKSIFTSEMSAAAKDVLQQELESCLQLYELEPENKWALFTSVLLMRAIDSEQYDSTMSGHLEQLTTIDAMRTNYYRDLRSKFIIENYIEGMTPGARELCLAGKGLTSLHHFQHFHLMKFVDLSSNHLRSVYPLCYLLCVEQLILDDNLLEECTDINNLFCLKKLSLKKNYIKFVENMRTLASCKQLEELFIADNPVVEIANIHQQLKQSLGAIVLDGTKL